MLTGIETVVVTDETGVGGKVAVFLAEDELGVDEAVPIGALCAALALVPAAARSSGACTGRIAFAGFRCGASEAAVLVKELGPDGLTG